MLVHEISYNVRSLYWIVVYKLTSAKIDFYKAVGPNMISKFLGLSNLHDCGIFLCNIKNFRVIFNPCPAE